MVRPKLVPFCPFATSSYSIFSHNSKYIFIHQHKNQVHHTTDEVNLRCNLQDIKHMFYLTEKVLDRNYIAWSSTYQPFNEYFFPVKASNLGSSFFGGSCFVSFDCTYNDQYCEML
jgi:hypothetical protein